MIIEEFDFYQQLPPKAQSELVDFLYKDTLNMFKSIFDFCEIGFRNELIV